MGPPISERKLSQEGLWETRKEILGWMFDGIKRTIKLLESKCTKLRGKIKHALEFSRKNKKAFIPLRSFKKLHGKLQFATIALAIGKPLMGPLDVALSRAQNSRDKRVTLMSELAQTLLDWRYIIKLIVERSTFCDELVLHTAAYQGFVDASKWGVGGVWFGRTQTLQPIVWFLQWPTNISNRLVSDANPTGDISISDLELLGIFINWLVLEYAVDKTTLKFNSVAMWCDNLPAVAWLYKMRNSSSEIAAHILRAFAIRLQHLQAAVPLVEHISGILTFWPILPQEITPLTTPTS